MNRRHRAITASLLATLASLLLGACCRGPQPGTVLDEAKQAGRTAASFPQSSVDYFHDMDMVRGKEPLQLTDEEIKGRNMWLVWTGGNDRFWDRMTQYTFGAFDMLKMISSHPSLGREFKRAHRWEYLGVVNEPCFEDATGPDKTRYGLWLDVRTKSKDCGPDPFEDEARYPGVKIGSRGTQFSDKTTFPIGSYYGYATGILGLRLFPNPAFDEKAAKVWDAERYYSDPSYYNNPKLVRPYRVGMSCGFCHVGPSPLHPPKDPAHPEFADLSSSVGAQYMWVNHFFIVNANRPAGQTNFMYQLVNTYRMGTMDTSLVSTDNINNPRSMNAVYAFVARMGLAEQLWHENLAPGEANNKQFGDFPETSSLKGFFVKATDHTPAVVHTPHVLKDGADSVGLLGALNRVYLNIGLFSEEWLLHFNPVVGGKPISPIEISVAEKNSAYWQATEAGTPYTALFFLKAAQPDHLADAPGGPGYLKADAHALERGKVVFAETCARCHSSKGPPPPAELGLDPDKCAGAAYLGCFKKYWTWTQTDDFKARMRPIVLANDFLDGNFLSTDARIPVTLLRTNVCSPLATNALAGNIWDNFSSHSYKELTPVGRVTLYHPFTGAPFPYTMPAGGRGYTRVPSLIALWSTAPYLLNNSVGPSYSDPSVASRMKSFDASIDQMLWPEKRDQDSLLAGKVPGVIDRTTARSSLHIPRDYLPAALQVNLVHRVLHDLVPSRFPSGGDLDIGPIPQGVPIGILANLQLLPETNDPAAQLKHYEQLSKVLLGLSADLLTVLPDASDAELRQKFSNVADDMLKVSKCPDFVVNRGHYFGTAQFNDQATLTEDEKAFGQEPALSDDDKRALITFLKTF
jgi:hypothetical protein